LLGSVDLLPLKARAGGVLACIGGSFADPAVVRGPGGFRRHAPALWPARVRAARAFTRHGPRLRFVGDRAASCATRCAAVDGP